MVIVQVTVLRVTQVCLFVACVTAHQAPVAYQIPAVAHVEVITHAVVMLEAVIGASIFQDSSITLISLTYNAHDQPILTSLLNTFAILNCC